MLATDQAGRGVPLVFLHPFPLSKSFWAPHRAVFAKNFHFISVDFPGFGQSPLSAEHTTMDSVAEALNHTLNQAGIDQKIVLIGVSMGGYAAFRFMAMFRERVRALALISTKATPDTDAARQKRFENIQLIERDGLAHFAVKTVPALLGKTTQTKNPDLAEDLKKTIGQSNAAAITAALRGLAARPDSTAVLHEIAVPAFVLAGEEDGIIPPVEMKQMAEQIKKADFQSLPEVGHLNPLENPSGFQNALLTFLKRRVL
jgi:pimeloyl-ACP methyl ester carboxylesterase